MFLIPYNDIRKEVSKNNLVADTKRYNRIIDKLHNHEHVSKDDFDYANKFAKYVKKAYEYSLLPIIVNYVTIRNHFVKSGLTPEDIDNAIQASSYYTSDGYDNCCDIPAEYDNIDFDKIASFGYIPAITKIVSREPDTIVFFADGTQTHVVCEKNETFDAEKGIYIAILKKAMGNKHLQHLFNLITNAENKSNNV